jgi:hypothetical protein
MAFHAAGAVTVTDGDVHGVELLHAAMSTLSAEFAWEGDPPVQLSGASGVLFLQGRGTQLSFGIGATVNFQRSVMLAPDDYAIDLRGISGGWYVKDISCGGKSVLHGLAPLGGDASCGGLRFLLAHDAASLTAHVAGQDGNPIADVYVAIVPESAATEAEMSAAMTFGQTGANGVYTAKSLPPGKYRVMATNETISLAANRVDKLWTAQGRAQEVEIGANASVQVQLEPQALQ